MEYLDGYDLETLVRTHGPIDPRRTLHILKQVCQSLSDAHANGLVHRDIKPANVFISQMGGTFDYVKVLDFGLAKPVSTEDDSGILTGTPAYLPPEAITGASPVGPYSDIYSLGCVAYFMLTGELVFDEKELIKVAAAHVDRTPIKPSLRTELPIPDDMEKLVLRCLAKDPKERYANAEQLATALRTLEVGTRWGQVDAREWWDKHAIPDASAA